MAYDALSGFSRCFIMFPASRNQFHPIPIQRSAQPMWWLKGNPSAKSPRKDEANQNSWSNVDRHETLGSDAVPRKNPRCVTLKWNGPSKSAAKYEGFITLMSTVVSKWWACPGRETTKKRPKTFDEGGSFQNSMRHIQIRKSKDAFICVQLFDTFPHQSSDLV